jgi:hypothetical protein
MRSEKFWDCAQKVLELRPKALHFVQARSEFF